MNVKHLVIIGAGAAALSTVACGYSIRTATDYNRNVNFSNYRTFALLPGNSSGNALMDQRATADVENALTSRGWTKVPEGQAQAAVVVHAATKTKHTYQTLYDGFGGGWVSRRGFGGRMGSATTYVNNYKVGTLVVDIFDAKTKEAIWRGSASDALSNNAAANTQATEQAIDKMFGSFPPGSPAVTGQH
jgi:hypothetical protein